MVGCAKVSHHFKEEFIVGLKKKLKILFILIFRFISIVLVLVLTKVISNFGYEFSESYLFLLFASTSIVALFDLFISFYNYNEIKRTTKSISILFLFNVLDLIIFLINIYVFHIEVSISIIITKCFKYILESMFYSKYIISDNIRIAKVFSLYPLSLLSNLRWIITIYLGKIVQNHDNKLM